MSWNRSAVSLDPGVSYSRQQLAGSILKDLASLQSIPKIRTLPIRQISEAIFNSPTITLTVLSSSPSLFAGNNSTTPSLTGVISSLVLPHHITPQRQADHNHTPIADGKTCESRMITRCFFCEEDVGTSYISAGVEDKPEAIGEGAFGVASYVRCKEVPGYNHRCAY